MDSRQQIGGARPHSEADFLKEAPLLAALNKRLAACSSPKEWAVIRAQQALYLARTYRIDEASLIPDEIRQRFRGHEDPEVFFWLWLLDGVLDFYRTVTTRGMESLQKAYAVARVCQRADLEEYAAAWAAHFCFNSCKYAEMVRWLDISRVHEATLAEAACRASLIAAGAWQSCGNDRAASVWFGRARDIGRSIGDRATIMASIENRALARLDHLWVLGNLGTLVADTLKEVELELRGGLSYEKVTGSDALASQGAVARIRVQVLKGEFASALAAIDGDLARSGENAHSTVRATAILRPWLRVKLGMGSDLNGAGLERLEGEVGRLDDDDAAVCWAQLAFIASSEGHDAKARLFAARSEEARMKNDATISRLEQEMKSCPALSI